MSLFQINGHLAFRWQSGNCFTCNLKSDQRAGYWDSAALLILQIQNPNKSRTSFFSPHNFCFNVKRGLKNALNQKNSTPNQRRRDVYILPWYLVLKYTDAIE